MTKTIAIITSDPESINYEILKKSYFFFKKTKNRYILIGSKKNILFNIKKNKYTEIIDVKWDGFKNKKKYLKKSFDIFFQLYKKGKVHGLINLPLDKKDFFNSRYPGVTEYISKKINFSGKETMLLFSKEFSVSPLTTHLKIKNISKNININKILNTMSNIDKFYKKFMKISNPKIAILGLNPHNGHDFNFQTEENKIIIPAIKKFKKNKIIGPLSPDSSFLIRKIKKINCLIGLYHDQVLTTFKYIKKFSAINITLGLPFIRISPDHGTGKDILNKNIANPESFLQCLKFFEKYHKSL